MPKRIETHVTVAGAIGSEVWGLITSDLVSTTLFPAFLGAAIQTIERARKGSLTIGDIPISFVTALAIGGWGGPFFAKMAPESETALPLMCFAAALYSRIIAEIVGSSIKNLIEKRFGDEGSSKND